MVVTRDFASHIMLSSGLELRGPMLDTYATSFPPPPELEIRGLKVYSPDGPRSGVVLIFLTQSTKSNWLAKISEVRECGNDVTFNQLDDTHELFDDIAWNSFPLDNSSVYSGT